MHFFCKKKTKQDQSVTEGSPIRDPDLLGSKCTNESWAYLQQGLQAHDAENSY